MTTENKNEEVVILRTKLENIETLITDLTTEIRNMSQNYVPRTEINLLFTQQQKEISEVKTDLKDNKRNVPNWISSIVAIVALAVAYFKG